jgi:hypothetical protein
MSKVKIDDVLEALEISNEEGNHYYNKITSQIIYIAEEEARIAEDADEDDLGDYPEWQREIIEAAIDIEENWDNYISLPSRFDIDEHNMMVEFCDSLDNERISNELLSALNGRGAFRRFKDEAIRLNVANKWYNYRDEALRKIAIDWCKDNDIEIIN